MTNNTSHLRQQLKARRRNISSASKYFASIRICLKAARHIQPNSIVASYLATPDEVNTRLLHTLLRIKRCQILAPCILPESELAFVKLDTFTPIAKNTLGIAEPHYTPDTTIPITSIDYIVTPLLGFDTNCNRLGMGGGYYDRLLSKTPRAISIGLAFDEQLTELKPRPWDQPLDKIQTPTHCFTRLR